VSKERETEVISQAPERWREYPRKFTDDDGTKEQTPRRKGYSLPPRYGVAIRDIN
jgi:hypothetical protein